MKKRILSLLLCLILCLSLLPTAALAEGTGTSVAIEDCIVTLSPEAFLFDNTTHTVEVNVSDLGDPLTKDTDYTVTGTTSASACGTYEVTVTGIGNCTGTVTKSWKIIQNPKVIFDANNGVATDKVEYPSASLTYTIPSDINGRFSYANCTFAGWNTKPDGSGTAYDGLYNNEITLVDETTTLYAQWQLDLSAKESFSALDTETGSGYTWAKTTQPINDDQTKAIYTLTLKNYTLHANVIFPDKESTDFEEIQLLVDGDCTILGNVSLKTDTNRFQMTIDKAINAGSGTLTIGSLTCSFNGDALTVNTDLTITSDLFLGASGGMNSSLTINNAALKLVGTLDAPANLTLLQHLTMIGNARFEIGGHANFHSNPTISLSDESVIDIAGDNTVPTIYKEGNSNHEHFDNALNGFLPDGYSFGNVNDSNYNLYYGTTLYTGPITLQKHRHSWTYSSSGATITATCSVSGCPNSPQTLTITAPTRTVYNGTGSETATLSATSIGGFTTLPAITYQKQTGDSTWGTATQTAPTNAGTYKASITLKNDDGQDICTAYVDYTIGKADPNPTSPTGLTATYGDQLSTVNLEAATGDNGTWCWDSANALVGDTGEQTHSATFTPTDTENYNTVTRLLTVTVGKAAQNPTAQSITATYGDTNKSVTVSNACGTVTYAVKEDNHSADILDVDPITGKLTFKKAGTATVIATAAEDSNHNSKAVEIPVTVGKATVTVAAMDREIQVGDEAPALSDPTAGTDYTVTGLIGQDTLDITVSLSYSETPDTTTAGTCTITLTVTGEDDRYEIQTSSGTLTISADDPEPDQPTPPPAPTPKPTPVPGHTYYVIDASANDGGSIDPEGKVSVRSGADKTFTIQPETGYRVADVEVDGKSVGAVTTYTFQNVTANHTITVAFEKLPFTDVPNGSYFEDAVTWAVNEGITNGVSDTLFDPDGPCTRAQAVTFLWRASGCPQPKTSVMPFADVVKGSYYYTAVLWAVENGITVGTSATTFSPNDPCTRAHIVTFLWRAMGQPEPGRCNPFTDVDADAYYAKAVLWAVAEGVTRGTSATTFSPDKICTRAQIVTFIYRALA